MKIERKLSAKTITGLSADEIKKKGREKKTYLYDVMGVANGTVTGETQYGPFEGLTGQFETKCHVTGEVKHGAKLFLPPHAHGLISGDGRVSEPRQFAFRIGVEPSDNQFGYEYFCEAFLDEKEADVFSTLRNRVPQLAAPKDEAKK